MARPIDFAPAFGSTDAVGAPTDPPSERIEVGVAIVGAGPGGLACAIRLGQLLEEHPRVRERLRARGEAALVRGSVAALVLNGGMATRFGGGAKGVVPVVEGRARTSFIAIKLAEAREQARALVTSIPVVLMHSFATLAASEAHLREIDWAGLAVADREQFAQSIMPRVLPDGTPLVELPGADNPVAAVGKPPVRARDQAGQNHLRRVGGVPGHLRLVPGGEERIEQPVVTLVAHHLVQAGERVLLAHGQIGVDASDARRVQGRQRVQGRRLAQPGPQHLGVAGGTERVGDPAQLGSQLRRPRLIQDGSERAQIAAQPPAADPHLVHGGVVPSDGGAAVGRAREWIARHEAQAVAVLARPGRSVRSRDPVVPHGSPPSAGREGGLSLPAASTAVTV